MSTQIEIGELLKCQNPECGMKFRWIPHNSTIKPKFCPRCTALKKFVSIDDIGTEDQRVVFGERRWTLPELVDNAEKNRNILILTSNLDADAIERKYGLRTRERVRAVCKVVVFKGESLRK